MLGALIIFFGFSTAPESEFEINKNLDIFSTVFKELSTYYVDDLDVEEFFSVGINSMLQSLDPYTSYIPYEEIDKLDYQTTGKYGGVGAIIRKQGDYIVVYEPYKGFPIEKAGIKAGDLIKEVDGTSSKGLSTREISDMLRGVPGTKTKLKIQRYGTDKIEDVVVTRGQIKISPVPYAKMLQDDIGYVVLTQFTTDCSDLLKSEISRLKREGANKIVLDLRGNPGGLLSEAVKVANLFVPKGKEVVSTRGKVRDWEKTYKTKEKPMDLDMPLVVLINGGSASASEIVAGVVQDYDRGILIGKQTFGKGLVQTTKGLPFKARLKLTTAKYYIPSGRCVQAIDYSDRDEDGKATKLPDSLRTEFETAGGRKVLDGAGVDPDFDVDFPEPSLVSYSLMSEDLLFNYAVKYHFENPSIADERTFKLSDADFKEFLAFIEDEEFEYKTTTEYRLERLETYTERDELDELLSSDIKRLEEALERDKSKDVDKFEEEVRVLLEREILTKYYHQEGKIASDIDEDPVLTKAIEVLTNESLYNKTLGK